MSWLTEPNWLIAQFNAGITPPLAAQLIRSGQAPKMPEFVCPSCRSISWQWGAHLEKKPSLGNFYIPGIIITLLLAPCTMLASLALTAILCVAWIISGAVQSSSSQNGQKRQCRQCGYIEKQNEARPYQTF